MFFFKGYDVGWFRLTARNAFEIPLSQFNYLVGFQIPEANDRADAYRKLFQIAWNEKMAEAGHSGGHLTSGAAAFVSTYVAPFVRQRQWNEEFVAEVLRGKAEGPAPGDADYNGESK